MTKTTPTLPAAPKPEVDVFRCEGRIYLRVRQYAAKEVRTTDLLKMTPAQARDLAGRLSHEAADTLASAGV
jgi:hypothetical protein